MNHRCSVFANSCLKLPVDPASKMPKPAYERRKKPLLEQCSTNSVSTTCSVSTADVDAEKLKDFYRSIPDYNEINHLSNEQFNTTLKKLREKKKAMLGIAVEHIDEDNGLNARPKDLSVTVNFDEILPPVVQGKEKPTLPQTFTKNYALRGSGIVDTDNCRRRQRKSSIPNLMSGNNDDILQKTSRKNTIRTKKHASNGYKSTTNLNHSKEKLLKNDCPKRNQSACSITWNDVKNQTRSSEVDLKFEQYFGGNKYISLNDIGDDFKTQSMPSSPLRVRRATSPVRRRKSITVPKPFKMTERDEEERMVHQLRSLQKSFSDDMLHQKCERRRFKAKPVPIESRIPLYDKILEDQAMRRAITKINSEAELRAQMKPFSFTKREEKKVGRPCDKSINVLPKTKKKKRFRARPIPKNLFSNYFYEKIKEDNYFRNMNNRIRAEEMLRSSSLPGTMAMRDRSRLSTPAAHSDLPIDPSPGTVSVTSSDRRCTSPTKNRKKRDQSQKEEFITTSPQPFRFNTADRAAKKMEEVVKKIYQESKSTNSVNDSVRGRGGNVYSALELRAASSGRSNLAALLRAEAVRRKFEMEAAMHIEDQHRRTEMRHRDRLLRSKPAWHLVKNNHEEDIAMRLQTRRDEERLRREEFLHEMELMYGRVQQQPMLFERYYAPRSQSAPLDSLQLSPRKIKKHNKNKSYQYNSPSPNRSRKVSINDTAELFNGDVNEYLIKIDNGELSDSEAAIDSDAK